jgi:peptidyl-prolyl cis-trans isomerase D
MFEFIRTHQRLMQFVLLLLILPFLFFGLESYSRFGEHENVVAKVAGQSITQQEWDAAHRQQIERFRQMFGSQFDPKMLDTPEAKQSVLDNLIAQRVIAAQAAREHLSVPDSLLQQTILAQLPDLTTADGKFDVERYKSLLAAQGLTPEMYQANLRRDLSMKQVSGAVESTAFAPKTISERLSDLSAQEREIQDVVFKPADYMSQVKVTDDMLKAYYDKNIGQFEVPEQAKAEYVVLDSSAVAAQISVSDADIKSYYEQNLKHYTDEEQRRARHILIKVAKGASEAEQAAAKAKAEKLLAQVRKNPSDFARLAKENSQDPGSASQGGDLGYFGKGMMVKPFEDTAYQLKEGEISNLIQTDFGYHIIQVTGIKPASVKPFEEVKGEIAADIKKQLAAKKYSEMAEIFSNTVYEQSDSLKPVADKLKLKIETVSGLTRTPSPAIARTAPYNQPKFLAALFSNDAIKNKRNTDAVEVAPDTLIAGHVLEYHPVAKRPFDEVKGQVRERVTQAAAAALAKKAGEEKLAAAKAAGAAASGFGDAQTVSRSNPKNLGSAAFTAVMKADATKLPAYVGVDLHDQGYAVYRINKVVQPTVKDIARRKTEQQQIAHTLAEEETYAYLEALKKKAKVEILASPASKADADEGAR